MSNFKSFGTQGLAHDVQYGKGGGRVVFADGVFSLLVSPTGTDLSRLKIADPKDPTDAVTLGAMTDTINHVYAKLDRENAALTAQTNALSGSITAIQTTLASTQAEMANVKLDAIVSADGTHSLTSTNGVLSFLGTDNVSFNVALTKSDVTLSATSTEVPDTDIRLVPQGAGHVVIGDGTVDGLIQPEGGHSLTIAGGDADTAGSIIIRGGHGTTPGHVEVHDLVDPIAAQDPVTLAFSTAAITKAASSIISGSLRAVVGSFTETQGDTVVMQVPAGTLLRLKVFVTAPFATGSTITVKSSTSTLALPAIIDETQTGIYVVELLQDTVADSITVSIVTTGGSGKGALALEYIAA